MENVDYVLIKEPKDPEMAYLISYEKSIIGIFSTLGAAEKFYKENADLLTNDYVEYYIERREIVKRL